MKFRFIVRSLQFMNCVVVKLLLIFILVVESGSAQDEIPTRLTPIAPLLKIDTDNNRLLGVDERSGSYDPKLKLHEKKSYDEQTLFAAKSGLLNIVNAPIIYTSKTGDYLLKRSYDHYKKKSSYNPDNLPVVEAASIKRTNLQEGCSAWGDASASECSCEKLCPDTFEILKITSDQNIPTENNSFLFLNHTERQKEFSFLDLYPINNNHGYCFGHSVLSEKFARLAIFGSICANRADSLCKDAERPKYGRDVDEKSWITFYERVVNDVFNNKPRIITEFDNMKSFSSDPLILQILLKYVVKSWGRSAITPNGYLAASKKYMKREDFISVRDELLYRLANHQAPSVVIGSFIDASHVVNVWAVRKNAETGTIYDKDGNVTFCVRNNNSLPNANLKCNSSETAITIGPSSEFREKRVTIIPTIFRKSIQNYTIAGNENFDIAVSIRNLRKMCVEIKCNNKREKQVYSGQ